jgi:methylmalonyl-CoA mutase C-terminal domain/subunit
MTIFPRIVKRLEERGVDDMILLGGGVMPDEDVVELKRMGVSEILLQDTPPDAIVATVRRLVSDRGPR